MRLLTAVILDRSDERGCLHHQTQYAPGTFKFIHYAAQYTSGTQSVSSTPNPIRV